MKAFLKVGSLFLFVFLSASCVLWQMGSPIYMGEKDSCGFAVNQYSGQGLRWDDSKFPISFYVHYSVPDKAKDNFISAVEHWNLEWTEYLQSEGVEPFPLFVVVSRDRYNGKPERDENNFLFFINDNFSRYESIQGVQAVTALNSIGHELRDTDILVNNENEVFEYYYDSSYNKEITVAKKQIESQRAIASSRAPGFWFKITEQLKQWWSFLLKPFQKKKPSRHIARISPKVPRGKVDFPSLIIHELGHVPGLAHFDHNDITNINQRSRSNSSRRNSYLSVMEPNLSSGRARRDITDNDLYNLLCGYILNNPNSNY